MTKLRLAAAAAASALALGALAAPASAATVTSNSALGSGASAVKPASVGSILCGGDFCIQRITSIVNGRASVKAWAWKTSFSGFFELTGGPDGYFDESPDQRWAAGGAGYVFTNVPQGDGYVASQWTDGGDVNTIGFRV